MSANTGILTQYGTSEGISQYYNSVATQFDNGELQSTKYCFLGRVDTLDDPTTPVNEETIPPIPELSQKNIKNIYKNMFIMKRVLNNNISPMIERIDWKANTTYHIYTDDEDCCARNADGSLKMKFYVKNKYNHVFKCLWNNGEDADNPDILLGSKNEPFFEPGYLVDGKIYIGSDGYKWMYMYTIEAGAKNKFMDTQYMPIPSSNVASAGLSAITDSGNVPIVGVTSGGFNYYAGNTTVTITGANTTQATAIATTEDGSITDILVTNPGSGYISANVVITSPTGSGATAVSYVSPVNGHGSDPFYELGANHIMSVATFSEDEAGLLSTNINYRQIGFLLNPVSLSSYPQKAEDDVYTLSTNVVLSAGAGFYNSDEIIFQTYADVTGNSVYDIENAFFSATCLDFNPTTEELRMINMNGTMLEGRLVVGASTGTQRTVSSISEPNFMMYSGKIIYVENREGTQRSPDGTEQFRLIIGM